ncbi:MAG: sensor histidine kinase [Kiritimatiellales bacterium]
MDGKTLIRKTVLLLGFLAVFFGVPPVVFQVVRTVDRVPCKQFSLSSGSFTARPPFGDCLGSLILPKAKDGAVSFGISNEGNETLSLCLCQLYFPHRIFENEEIVSQNISPDAPHFDPAMRCKTFQVPPRSTERMFRIEGSGTERLRVYLGRNSYMFLQQRIAAELNSFLAVVVLALGLLMFAVSVVYKRMNALNVAVLAVFVFFLLRISILDNLSVGSVFFPVSAEQFGFWDSMTTFGFSLSMFLIYAFFFDVEPRRFFYPILAGYMLFMLVDFIVTSRSGGTLVFLPAVLLCRVLLFIWILGFAVLSRKPFSISVTLLHAVSDGFMAYYAFLKTHPGTAGLLAFHVDIGFLGLSIQFLFALVLFTVSTIIRSRDYSRLLMLRGLEHDLKIPLSVIKLNHQMIRRYSLRNDDANGIRFSEAIDRALTDLDGMLQNLRYHLERRSSSDDRTDLAVLFQSLRDNFLAVCAARNVVLSVQIPDSDLYVAVDPDILKRILHNLLDNALKHGGSELCVIMKAEARHGKVMIVIRDNGRGMTPAERRRSFRLFHKADPARGVPGLGLGLHVVRNLIRRYGGSIHIQSQKGAGTAVTIVFPRA